MDAFIQIAGNGYQVQLTPARDAGFTESPEPSRPWNDPNLEK